MRHRIFTREEIAAYVLSVQGTDLADDETIRIHQIERLKNVTPPVWVVDYTHRSGSGMHFHIFHNKAIVTTKRDYHGNAQLCLPETVILPEVQTEKGETIQ